MTKNYTCMPLKRHISYKAACRCDQKGKRSGECELDGICSIYVFARGYPSWYDGPREIRAPHAQSSPKGKPTITELARNLQKAIRTQNPGLIDKAEHGEDPAV